MELKNLVPNSKLTMAEINQVPDEGQEVSFKLGLFNFSIKKKNNQFKGSLKLEIDCSKSKDKEFDDLNEAQKFRVWDGSKIGVDKMTFGLYSVPLLKSKADDHVAVLNDLYQEFERLILTQDFLSFGFREEPPSSNGTNSNMKFHSVLKLNTFKSNARFADTGCFVVCPRYCCGGKHHESDANDRMLEATQDVARKHMAILKEHKPRFDFTEYNERGLLIRAEKLGLLDFDFERL